MSVLPTITVIIPVYKVEPWLDACVESVLAQTYPNIEYLIVDGKSTDKTMEIVEEFADKFAQKGYTYRTVSE